MNRNNAAAMLHVNLDSLAVYHGNHGMKNRVMNDAGTVAFVDWTLVRTL